MMFIEKIKNTLEELRLLGFKGSAYRIYYELSLRTGLRRDCVNLKSLEININLNTWRKERRRCFFPPKNEILKFYDSTLTPKEKEKIVDIANRAIKGEILCFSKWYANFGKPINWHYNPKRKVSWPLEHWTKVMKYEKECGDIKLTWEVNRFPHLYYLVRAYIITGDSKYVKAFSEQLKSWEKDNPYDIGINWNSGQELSIRILAWIFALYIFGDDLEFKESDFERLMKLFYLHARHIEKNIDYAYNAVYNNHLIGEALALYIVGTLFPFFNEAERWKKKGKSILEGNKCLKQFYSDGGYCQLSFNYQRLALHYYLWALRVGEVNNDRFKEEIYKILDRSAEFLYSFINLETGVLPNWGANDGALLNPWTVCDYKDYRPIINALSYISRKKRVFPLGPWDEELLWFFGEEALNSETEPYKLKSKIFPMTGIHILRKKDCFAVFRCGTIIDRFGQADQLHVDIWWKGINIAVDGGSYLYNDELHYHRYFMGTNSHNTVTVDNKDQMLLYRKFKWLYWTKARVIDFNEKFIEGEHYGYKGIGVIHRRKVEIVEEGNFLVFDILYNLKREYRKFDLHWLLNDYPYKLNKLNNEVYQIEIQTDIGLYYIYLKGPSGSSIEVNRALNNEFHDGWQSRYYGYKSPALSVHLIYRGKENCNFISLFTEDRRWGEEVCMCY